MRRRRSLGVATIGKAAAAIAARQGLEAVTVRAVAERLQVTPMALYRYVGSADGLRTATLEHVLRAVPAAPADGSVADRLRAFASAARAVLARYPGVARAVLTEWVNLIQGARLLEGLLTVAAEATDDPEEQVDLANAVFVYVLMRVSAEHAVLAGGRRRRLPVVAAHPERFPRLSAVQSRFAEVDVDRHFHLGLDALLDALLGGLAGLPARSAGAGLTSG